MERLKVKASSEAESKEVQELFFELGAKKRNIVENWHSDDYQSCWFALGGGGELFDEIIFRDNDSGINCASIFKEINLQGLRDMVVLKRSNPKDANVYQDGDIPCLYDLYLTENKELYFYHCGKKAWILSNLNDDKDYYELLKPIKEEAMKESLNDKIASAEVARQEEKHSHYKKDVSHLNVIDPYRIADLYALHPCAEHIMKKSLCAGNRGHKDTLRDTQDIIDTAERWKQMIEEDNNEI